MQSLVPYLVEEVGEGHGGGVEGKLQLCSAAHHTLGVGVARGQRLDQESVSNWSLHQKACLNISTQDVTQ